MLKQPMALALPRICALFPRIGQEVSTIKTRLGRVEQVIIHPRRRRVTALVVRGWIADTQYATAELAIDPPPRRERWLVIPTSAVRELTLRAILLHMSDDAALRHADLDPAAYVPPAADWQPPYRYTHAEVLLERVRAFEQSLHRLIRSTNLIETLHKGNVNYVILHQRKLGKKYPVV